MWVQKNVAQKNLNEKNVIQKIFVTNKNIYLGQKRKKIKNLAKKIKVKKKLLKELFCLKTFEIFGRKIFGQKYIWIQRSLGQKY